MSPAFTMTRRVQFAETDMAGVLHFANYLRIMEEVEHAFWRSLGLSVITDVDGVSISWPRVAASCEYLSPVHFETELNLSLKVVRVSERSVTYEVQFESDGRKFARGQLTAVCCTHGSGRFQAIPIPQSIRRRLEPHLQPD